MPKLTPTDWGTLERVFTADGWKFRRQKGSHRSYVKEGFIRPVVIPMYDEVGVDIINANRKTANMSRERYFELLGNC
jgi:predicted RNA binding protein YcfA (HicA-like mRNA interferase family)